MPPSVLIRPFRLTDSVGQIMALLHKAYAPLAEEGMRYLASHQDEATTLERLTSGFAFIAENENAIIGTVTLYRTDDRSSCEWYRRAGVFHFGQFGVHPDFQERGIGLALMERIEAEAGERGAVELALDTSEKALHLIRWYERLGFGFVQHVSWAETNYRSVVLSKPLPQHPPTSTSATS